MDIAIEFSSLCASRLRLRQSKGNVLNISSNWDNFDVCTLMIYSNNSLLHILGQQDRKIVHLNGGKTKGGF